MLNVTRSAIRNPQSIGAISTFVILSGRLTTNAARTRISPLSITEKSTVWIAAAKWPGPYATRSFGSGAYGTNAYPNPYTARTPGSGRVLFVTNAGPSTRYVDSLSGSRKRRADPPNGAN